MQQLLCRIEMRINHIFEELLEAQQLSEEERVSTQSLLRRIIVGRSTLDLCNDVASLYKERVQVAKHFDVPVSDLDVLWDLPAVKSYLEQECSDEESDAEYDQKAEQADEDDDEESDADYDEDEEEEDEEAEDLYNDDTYGRFNQEYVIHDICAHIIKLRQQMYWFGGVVMLMHSTIAFATIATLTATYWT